MGASIWSASSTPLVPSAAYVLTERLISTAGQTVFNITNFTYQLGGIALRVFRNGQLMTMPDDYTETSTSSFTMTSGMNAGDELFCIGNTFVSGGLGQTDATLVTYTPTITGAIPATVQRKLDQLVNALDFGVVADGSYNAATFAGNGTGTNNTTALQAAINAVATAGGGVLLLPPGTLRCDSGLTLNVGKVKLQGQYSWLDFSNLGAGVTGITVVGNANTDPFGNSPGGIEDVNLLGPGDASTSTALEFISASADGSAWTAYRNMAILGWLNGFYVRTNSYGITVDNCDVRVGGTCIQDETAATNTGERITICNSVFSGAQYGVIAQNGASDFFFSGTSIDTSLCAVYIRGSTVALHGCHIECTGQAVNAATGGGSAARLVISGSRIIQSTNTGATAFIRVDDSTYFELIGGDISFADPGTVTSIYISTNSRFVMLGTFRNYPNGEVDNINGVRLITGTADAGFTGLTTQSGKETFTAIATATATPIVSNLFANPGLYHVYGYASGVAATTAQGQCTLIVNDVAQASLLQNASGANWLFSIGGGYLRFTQSTGLAQNCVVTWVRVA